MDGIEKDQQPMGINKRNFDKACRFAQMSGVSTALLTGKGEPLVYPIHIYRYLEMLQKWEFPFIELQTNGILLKDMAYNELMDWYAAGLTTISLSCVHWLPAKNQEIFGEDIHLLSNIAKLHELGFSVRVSCVGIGGVVDDVNMVQQFAMWCKRHEVEQFTWRPVTNISLEETKNDRGKHNIYQWISLNCVNGENQMEIDHYFKTSADPTLLLELAHGAKVYDLWGQNISINSCLTHSPNPDDIRQLIFFPDGHLRYSWTKQGAIII